MRLPRIHNWDDILGLNDSKSVCENARHWLHVDIAYHTNVNHNQPVLIGAAVRNSDETRTLWTVNCLPAPTRIESEGFEC